MNLLCISQNGTPIFSKKRGDSADNIPYSTIASFYSISLFCKAQNVVLENTRYCEKEVTRGFILWREIENFYFVANSNNHIPHRILAKLIEATFNCLVMHCGLSEIKNMKNIDRFKRDLTSTFHQMVDKLMDLTENDNFDYNENLILSHESHVINQKLQTFSDQSALPYCFIMVKNKILCATEAFKCLTVLERKLLNLLLSNNLMKKQEIPIYLPILSPFLAYRLVNLPLIKDVTIGIICGQNPPIAQIDILLQEFWPNSYDELLMAANLKMPSSISIDSIVLGYLIVNVVSKKYIMSNYNNQTTNRKQVHRTQILVAFFNQFELLVDDCYNDDPVTINELYFVSDYHKCHALLKGENILCVLYSNVPTYSMRHLSEEIIKNIVSDKKIIW